jgi:hypothetical protein
MFRSAFGITPARYARTVSFPRRPGGGSFDLGADRVGE